MAASAANHCPPSRNESGVTFTTPMTSAPVLRAAGQALAWNAGVPARGAAAAGAGDRPSLRATRRSSSRGQTRNVSASRAGHRDQRRPWCSGTRRTAAADRAELALNLYSDSIWNHLDRKISTDRRAQHRAGRSARRAQRGPNTASSARSASRRGVGGGLDRLHDEEVVQPGRAASVRRRGPGTAVAAQPDQLQHGPTTPFSGGRRARSSRRRGRRSAPGATWRSRARSDCRARSRRPAGWRRSPAAGCPPPREPPAT